MEAPVRYFEEKRHAEDYVKYRIPFPTTVVDRIASFIKDGGGRFSLAVDVGCGTGHHSTLPLARVFDNTIGVDVSQEQINQAPRDLRNITFRVGRAEDLHFIDDSSVDLVSVATAIHWLNVPALYKEVDRILKPRGCLAVYWQQRQRSENKLVETVIDEFCDATSEFRHEGLKKLYDRNEYPECPYGNWSDQSMFFTKRWTVDDLVNREATDSNVRTFLRNYPQSTVVQDFKQRLTAVLTDTDSICTTSPVLETLYKVHLLLCRKT